ncbi:MAG: nuclear transport factor 2 family protein [Candidatus Thorarchaeota archaeon]
MKQKEVDKIKETIHNYVSGVVEFDFDRGESAWHPDGLKISLDSGGRLVTRNILDTRPNLTPDEIRQMRNRVFQNATIQAIDVTGIAASVKLVWQFEMDGDKKRITDYVLLLRGEEDWRIVGKIYNEESA